MKYTSFNKALRDAVDNPKATAIVEHPLDHSVTPAKFVRYTVDVALAVDEDIPDAARCAIVEAIRRERLWATGEAIHEADMVAVAPDGLAYDDSCRGWGALLAEAWCDPADRMAYAVFAWGVRPGPAAPPGARTVEEVLEGKPADELHRPRSGFTLRDMLPKAGG